MCWNQFISINTYVFGIFVLLLIAINNRYSNYKINEFNNPFVYFFFISVITMQLFEFILWRNLDNKFINETISKLGAFLLIIQPIASLFMLKNIALRNKLLLIYSIPALSYFIFKLFTGNFYTTVSKNGHLKWNWGTIPIKNSISDIFGMSFYLFFLYFSIIKNKLYIFTIISLLFYGISYYNYYKEGTAGSLWCWSVNIIMFYLLFKLLFLLPYKELISRC
jgi:hypothetical protein